MSRLSSLEAQLSRLKQRKKELEKSLKVNRDRKDDIEKIISKLKDVVDDAYGGINKFISEIREEALNAAKGSLLGQHMETSVTGSREHGSSQDGDVSSALDDLREELRKVKDKIEDQDTQLRSIRNQIDTTNDEIWRERKREAEEALKNLING